MAYLVSIFPKYPHWLCDFNIHMAHLELLLAGIIHASISQRGKENVYWVRELL
jgi:hypothetical protein